MNRFEIVKRTAEVKWNDRFNIIPGCTEYDEEPEVIKTFDNLGAAIKALYQYKTEINEFSANTGTMYQVIEYAVQEIRGDLNHKIGFSLVQGSEQNVSNFETRVLLRRKDGYKCLIQLIGKS